MMDARRIEKYFADDRAESAIIEIFIHNWSVLKHRQLRTVFKSKLKQHLVGDLCVFKFFTFTHIVLLLFNTSVVSKYVMKTASGQLANNSLFLQTGCEEWVYLLGFYAYSHNKVCGSSVYGDFSIRGWLYALFVYLGIDGTHFDDRIVGILNEMFARGGRPERMSAIFMVARVIVRRKPMLVHSFTSIYESALGYEASQVLSASSPAHIKATECTVFWHLMHFYIDAFSEYYKLGLEVRYFDFLAGITDDLHKGDIHKAAIQNFNVVLDTRLFITRFPFFEELVLATLNVDGSGLNHLSNINPHFVPLCVLKTCSLVFKVKKYTAAQIDILCVLLSRWIGIATHVAQSLEKKSESIDVQQLSTFLYVLYYNVECHFVETYPEHRITGLYRTLIQKLSTIFLRVKRRDLQSIGGEKLLYLGIIKKHFAGNKKVIEDTEDCVLIKAIDRSCVFKTKFGQHSPYFRDLLEVLNGRTKVTLALYRRVYSLLLTREMIPEILTAITCAIGKVEIRLSDAKRNYISSLEWVGVLDELGIVHTSVKREIVGLKIEFLNNRKIELDDVQRKRLSQLVRKYRIATDASICS